MSLSRSWSNSRRRACSLSASRNAFKSIEGLTAVAATTGAAGGTAAMVGNVGVGWEL